MPVRSEPDLEFRSGGNTWSRKHRSQKLHSVHILWKSADSREFPEQHLQRQVRNVEVYGHVTLMDAGSHMDKAYHSG